MTTETLFLLVIGAGVVWLLVEHLRQRFEEMGRQREANAEAIRRAKAERAADAWFEAQERRKKGNR
jgi:hypothetical protein